MASRRLKKRDEIPWFYDDDEGVTVTVPAEDDDPSTPDEAMYLYADDTIRAAEEQLRLDRASGFKEPVPQAEPSPLMFLQGGKLCVECLCAYPAEAQVRCCTCGDSACPDCSVELEELDTVVCPACIRTNAVEA